VTPFYHYTCDHGHEEIGDSGHLKPLSALVGPASYASWSKWQLPMAELIWLTDLNEPIRDGLGLTMKQSTCDRTRHRYRAVGYLPARYTAIRRDLPKRLRDDLESVPGVLPAHWWVAWTPVPVVYDPIVVEVGRSR
jgi:hypothetical protein